MEMEFMEMKIIGCFEFQLRKPTLVEGRFYINVFLCFFY